MNRLYITLLVGAIMFSLSSCFTGVESTKKITDKDVKKAEEAFKNSTSKAALTINMDSVPSWKAGKLFYVVDNQARLLFTSAQETNLDTLKLKDSFLIYNGYKFDNMLGKGTDVILQFTDKYGHLLEYSTHKKLEEFTSSYSIPSLVDYDVVRAVANQLTGKELYIKTSIWYNPTSEDEITGRKFIKVGIDSVSPGNKVFPLKILFHDTSTGKQAMLWMSIGNISLKNRAFEALFSWTDVRKSYLDIQDKIWSNIVNGTVELDMKKNECLLSLGSPARIERQASPSGLVEYWFYDGGVYLIFRDGLLKAFKK